MRAETVRERSRMRGTLVEEHHGGVPESLHATHAKVRRIQVATQEFRLTGGAFSPVSGTTRLREVTRVPEAFRNERVSEATRRIEIGVLCDIDTDGAS